MERAIKFGQSRMRDTWPATLGTRYRTKINNKKQHMFLKRGTSQTPPKTGGEPMYYRNVSSSCFL